MSEPVTASLLTGLALPPTSGLSALGTTSALWWSPARAAPTHGGRGHDAYLGSVHARTPPPSLPDPFPNRRHPRRCAQHAAARAAPRPRAPERLSLPDGSVYIEAGPPGARWALGSTDGRYGSFEFGPGWAALALAADRRLLRRGVPWACLATAVRVVHGCFEFLLASPAGLRVARTYLAATRRSATVCELCGRRGAVSAPRPPWDPDAPPPALTASGPGRWPRPGTYADVILAGWARRAAHAPPLCAFHDALREVLGAPWMRAQCWALATRGSGCLRAALLGARLSTAGWRDALRVFAGCEPVDDGAPWWATGWVYPEVFVHSLKWADPGTLAGLDPDDLAPLLLNPDDRIREAALFVLGRITGDVVGEVMGGVTGDARGVGAMGLGQMASLPRGRAPSEAPSSAPAGTPRRA